MKSSKKIIISAFFIFFLISGSKAFSLNLSLTNSFLGEVHTNNNDNIDTNDNYQSILDRFNFFLYHGSYSLFGRFETATFFNAKSKNYEDNYNLEKITFKISKPGIKIYVGDFYQVLGRGLALALRKMDELGIDTTLRGMKFHFNNRDLSITGFGGYTNIVNVDSKTEKKMEDPFDVITGGEIKFKSLKKVILSGNTFFIFNRKDFPPYGDIAPQKTANFGASLEIPGINFYSEFNYKTEEVVNYQADVDTFSVKYDTLNKDGYIGYFSFVFNKNFFTLVLEGKYQKDFEITATRHKNDIETVFYNIPLTLEKEDVRVKQYPTMKGGRVKLGFNIYPILTKIYFNYSYFFNSPESGFNIQHFYLTIDGNYKKNTIYLTSSAGIRTDEYSKMKLYYEDFLFQFPINISHVFELYEKIEYFDEEFLKYTETTMSMTYTYLSKISLILGLDTSTKGDYKSKYFPSISLMYRYKSDSSIKLFAGRRRGGLVCSGGVCRTLPAFSGFFVEWVHSL